MDVTTYFSLEGFAHQKLFEGCSFVWEPLDRLPSYLRGLSLGVIEAEVAEGAYLVAPELISLGKGTRVEPGAYIEGPCVIGENCVVRHGAYIRGNLLAGNSCVIGHATEVKNSIFLNGAKAPHFNYVGDSILGGDVNLGAGLICANVRLDHASIHVKVDGVRVDTKRIKLGAIVGDGASLGCNCVLNPGTLIGKGARLIWRP